MGKSDPLRPQGKTRKPAETGPSGKEKRGTEKICPPCVVVDG